MEWRIKFPKAAVYHLGAVNSDHCPLLIDSSPSDTYSPRPFRFEEVWIKDPRCFSVINEAWKKEVFGSPCFKLCRKQQHIAAVLKRWNRETFGFCKSRINDLNSRLEKI